MRPAAGSGSVSLVPTTLLPAARGDEADGDGGQERHAAAEEKGDARAGVVDQLAEDQGGGQGGDAERQVVEAEGGAAALGRHEVGDQRLLDALGGPEVEAVSREQ